MGKTAILYTFDHLFAYNRDVAIDILPLVSSIFVINKLDSCLQKI